MNILVVLLLESVAGYAALLATLGTMSALGLSTASFLYRLLASYGMLLVCAIYGVFASIAFRLVGQHRSAQWTVARAFKYAMAIATGVRFEVVGGREHLRTRPAVLVANHQTALDVLFLGEIFPKHCSVTAKKSLKRVPFLGWFMALSGTVFIDRANRSTALKAFEGAAAEMKEHRQSVLIFPEGTRSYAKEPMLLGFKKGAFHLAVQAQVPIVPIVSACYSGVLGADEWRFRRGTIPVVVLPPISTQGLTSADVDQLTQDTRDEMLRALIKVSGSVQGQRAGRAYHPTAVLRPTSSLPEDNRAALQMISGPQSAVKDGLRARS